MKKFREVIPFFLSLLLFALPVWFGIASCRLPITVYITPTPAPRNAWLVEWLEEPICQPSCFLGITPGMTTMLEAIRLLSSRTDVQIRQGPLVAKDYQELTWDFTTSTLHDGGRLNTDEEGKAVSFIDLSIGSDQYLILAELIESFGPPDHVYLPDCRGRQCVVHLIYTTSGMVLEPFLPAKVDKNNKSTVDISPEVRIEEIWFFPSGEDGYRGAFGYWANYLSESQLPWNGYTTYTEK